MCKWFSRCWRLLPIIGGLPFSTRLAHKEASKEIALTVFFAGLPLVLPLLVSLVIPELHTAQFFGKLIGEGELYLYAAAFVGPLIYAVFKDRAVADDAADVEDDASDTISSNNTELSSESRSSPRALSPQKRNSNRTIFGLLFPDGIWFIILSFLILLVCTVAMVLIRVVPIGENLLAASRPALRHVSEIVYAISVFCLYCASVYRNDLEKADHAMRSTERAFTAKWNSR